MTSMHLGDVPTKFINDTNRKSTRIDVEFKADNALFADHFQIFVKCGQDSVFIQLTAEQFEDLKTQINSVTHEVGAH